MIRFTKADPAVDSHFTDYDPRVLVKPAEVPVKPLYPEDDGFWDQFLYTVERVTDAKTKSKANAVADCFERDLKLTRADQCAKAVHKDWPSDLMLVSAKDAASKGEWRDLGLEGVFTDRVVLLNSIIGMAAHQTSPSSFCYKDKMRVPRPEEVAGAIIRGEIDNTTVPIRVLNALREHPDYREMESDQRAFTMFEEGSPPHGSCGAMHSAAATAGATAIKVMISGANQSVDQCALNVGDFRCCAGVHYPQDNDIGFWIGQETANRWLPDYLVSIGADRSKVEMAMLDAQTDWLKG